MGREVQRKEILSDIMNIKSKSSHFYQLDNHIIGAGKNKYLALPISDDLKWSSHIHKITSKANCTVRFLHYNLHQDYKKIAYFSIVGPVLEYGAVICDPHSNKAIDKIENI